MVMTPLKEASVTEVSTIGLDIAKHSFQVHGADVSGRVMFRRKITRAKLLMFFASQPRCLVALEACGGAHYWGREIRKLGHTVRLIPPAYVKPFVLTRKNSLFAGSDGGARCWAVVASLVATAKLNGVEPQAWLTDVLERMVSGRTKAHELERLLPWTWKLARPIDT